MNIIIQARTGSSRLPSKMILPFYRDKSILEIVIERLASIVPRKKIIVATTIHKNDDVIEEIANQQKIKIFRGSENDVLDRFISTANYYNIDQFVRLCADNPFIDLNNIQYLIKMFHKSKFDYWCYSLSDNTPTIKTHYGFWAEGVTTATLQKISHLTEHSIYREHVTNYIYKYPSLFNIWYEKIPTRIEESKNIRLTVDTIEDFNLQKEIFSIVTDKNCFSSLDIVDEIERNQLWIEEMKKQINRNRK